MIGLRQYLLVGAVLALVALSGGLWWLQRANARLTIENAALTVSNTALEMDRELARDARAVADARARRVEVKAREYDTLREGILRDGEDADLPAWLFDVLVGLRSGPDRETDQPGDPG